MAYFLITRPNHDLPTTYLHAWSTAVTQQAEKSGFSIIDLDKEKANRPNLEKYLTTKKASFIFLNGHGSEDVICGYMDEVLLDKSTKPESINDSIIYARSCNAGSRLAPTLVSKGLKAFIGYKEAFSFHYLVDYASKPLKDKLAELFLTPSNLVGSTILKGSTVSDAHDRSSRQMRQNLSNLISSSDKTFRDAAPAMYFNILSQVLVGDANAKV